MADTTPKSYSADPTLYLYTSLTAGSSHIITATSRLETILKANKIPFRALDVATDEKARMLWGRRSKGRKLPGLVKFGSIVGDLDEIEEWNEYGELKEQIGATPAVSAAPVTSTLIPPPRAPSSTSPSPKPVSEPSSDSEHILFKEPSESHRKPNAGTTRKDDTPLTMAMRQAGAEAAQKAGQKKAIKPGSLLSNTPTSPDAAAPVVDTKLARAAEDPHASTETTAAKIPAQLAAEGAKRTSVDKIAESGSSDETETDPAISAEESNLQARRTSSITKAKTPLSTETSANDPDSTQEPHFEGRPQEHRGSTVSQVSKEEIESIEKADAIPEEEEAAESAIAGDEVDCPTKSSTLADVTSQDKQEEPTSAKGEVKGQGAGEGDDAGVSVGD